MAGVSTSQRVYRKLPSSVIYSYRDFNFARRKSYNRKDGKNNLLNCNPVLGPRNTIMDGENSHGTWFLPPWNSYLMRDVRKVGRGKRIGVIIQLGYQVVWSGHEEQWFLEDHKCFQENYT